MLCGSHLCPFSPFSQVEQWPQAKRADHIPGKMLNSAAECADRARIEYISSFILQRTTLGEERVREKENKYVGAPTQGVRPCDNR
jgi:hypothetical protein